MNASAILIDGSQGEGGGQILRTALGLSLVTGRAFRIEKIRAGRKKPGILRQHLTAVNAAAEIGDAEVRGAEIGSPSLDFKPRAKRSGRFHFAVGTAGSATLVLQTILPALMLAETPSELILEGGTHNPMAPPFDFIDRVFLPLLARMGPRVSASLERPGFYPAGGGRMNIKIEPVSALNGLELLERGAIVGRRARAVVAQLDRSIAERELKIVQAELDWPDDCLVVEKVHNSQGPGNVVMVEIEGEHAKELITAFGEKSISSEAVAKAAVRETRRYLDAGVPVGLHLADQLLIPLALAGGGVFRTLELAPHAITNAAIIERFLAIETRFEKQTADDWLVKIRKPSR